MRGLAKLASMSEGPTSEGPMSAAPMSASEGPMSEGSMSEGHGARRIKIKRALAFDIVNIFVNIIGKSWAVSTGRI